MEESKLTLEQIKQLLETKGTVNLSLNDYIKDQIYIAPLRSNTNRPVTITNSVGKTNVTLPNNFPIKVESGVYYNVNNVINLMWNILNPPQKTVNQNVTVLDEDNKIIKNVNELYNVLCQNQNTKSARELTGNTIDSDAKYILGSDLIKIINQLLSQPEILINEYYSNIHLKEQQVGDSFLNYDINMQIERENIKTTTPFVPNNSTKDPKNFDLFPEQNPLPDIDDNEPEVIVEQEKNLRQKISQALENYLNRSDTEKEEYHNVKREKSKKSTPKFIALGLVALVATGIITWQVKFNKTSLPKPETQITELQNPIDTQYLGENNFTNEEVINDIYNNFGKKEYELSNIEYQESSEGIGRIGNFEEQRNVELDGISYLVDGRVSNFVMADDINKDEIYQTIITNLNLDSENEKISIHLKNLGWVDLDKIIDQLGPQITQKGRSI